MNTHLRAIHIQAPDFWLARLSVLAIAALQLLMINDLTVGPRWFAPVLEVALLFPLSVATAWTQANARDASTDEHWDRVCRQRKAIRISALALTALITVINLGALVQLVHQLLHGTASKAGQTLLLDALNIWGTNVIAFGLWFWSIDRGGPASRGICAIGKCDFLFPQMTMDGETPRPAGLPAISTTYISASRTQRRSRRRTRCRSPGARNY